MTEPRNLHALSAVEAARLIREGVISSEELVEACLARIREVDPDVQAWAFLDPDHALGQARAADAWRLEGRPVGPLHGVPVGVKDIIDTADMPTENGSVLHAGRQPGRDATVVAMLRAAGAVIMGKTVTTEFATYAPGKTRNPHDPAHTPGGSSSGSAAAVAAGMVPLALGSQTNGSVIRPAAFCGVYGFKPTHGLIPRHGVFQLSRTLDHVGLFARTSDDIALLAEQLVGYDERDPDTRPRARIPYREMAAEEPPLSPMFAFVKTSRWDRVTDETREAFAELAGAPRRPRGGGRAGRGERGGVRVASPRDGSRDGAEPRAGMGARARAPVGVASRPGRAGAKPHGARVPARASPAARRSSRAWPTCSRSAMTPSSPPPRPAPRRPGSRRRGIPRSARCGPCSACRR